MARAAPRRRRSSGFKTVPDPAKIGPLLRDAGFVGCDGDPISCTATFDADGTPTGITARYEGGWSCRMRLRKNRTYSLTQAWTGSFTAQPKAEA